MRRRSPLWLEPMLHPAVASCIVLVTCGCTQLTDFSVRQCESDSDCDLLVGVSHCEESSCRPGCSSNRHCTSIDPRAPICQWPGGDCVALLKEEQGCYLSSYFDTVSMGGLTAESMLLVGAFAPSFRSSLWLTLELAADEINALGSSVAGEAFPPLLIALCDGSQDASVEHLTQGLGARALIASLEDAPLRAALVNPVAADAILYLSPGGSTSPLADFGPQADLLWYLGPRYADAAAAYEPGLLAFFSSVAARGVEPASMRIVSVVGASSEDRNLARAVREFIRVGDDDADILLTQNRFRTLEVSDRSVAARANVVEQISNFAPDVVLVFASGSFPDSGGVERVSVAQALEAVARPDWQPLYLFGPRNTGEASPRRLAATSASFRERAVGVSLEAPLDPVLGPELEARFQASFPDAVTPESALSASFDAYDALYLLVYSLVAAPDAGASGADAPARPLERLTRAGAEAVSFGPSGFARALTLLRSGMTVDFNGTRGPMRFDPVTHTRAAFPGLYCWAEDGRPSGLAAFTEGSLLLGDAACAARVFGEAGARQ